MFNTILQKGKEIINTISEKIKNKKERNKENTESDNTAILASERQMNILKKLSSGKNTPLNLKQRATIIIEVIENKKQAVVAEKVNSTRQRVSRWTKRWVKMQFDLNEIEIVAPHTLKRSIISLLSDSERSGKPSTIKTEQVAAIIFLSLQKPELLGLPISHWTAATLREKAIEMEIVKSISVRQVGRFLKSMDIKVHQYQGWLNSIEKNPDFIEFKKRIEKICEIYRNVDQLYENGTIVTCSDEKTGIQAIEHLCPSKPVQSGVLEKIEQEYKRNGTTTIIATRDVRSGEILEPLIQPTRTEIDYKKHIESVINLDPIAKRIMIMDQLNTHMSESMVKLVARECGINEDLLGIKGEIGILKSKNSRKEFLEDPSHRIQILFTPKHTSWMNQIEIWFSIVSRQLLNRRYSFKSVKELEEKISNYIEYYNNNLAKQFKWSYTGKLLKA